jgi:hypothetical protein
MEMLGLGFLVVVIASMIGGLVAWVAWLKGWFE